MIICFSRIVDKNIKRKYPSNIPIDGADDNYNRRIIEGLEQNGEYPILINFMPYHSFPASNFFFFNREETFVNKRKIINVGYINLPLLKGLTLKRNIIKEVKKIVKKTDLLNLLIYDSYSFFLDAALNLKKWNKSIKTTLIAPSLPTLDVPRKDLKIKLVHFFDKSLLKKGAKMDSFVLLTEHMNEVINKNLKPYVVIEGIAPDLSSERIGDLPDVLEEKKYVLYSGRLDKIYGIDKLVDCFLNNKIENLYLVLAGVGDYTDKIREAINKTDRIIYLGFLQRPELNAVQKNAFFLINTRTPEGIYTRYSFPSKTLEYLVSGKPTLMFKLPGIPDEYDKYLNYIKGNTIRELRVSIREMYSLIEKGFAYKMSKEGQIYTMNYKSSKNQATKLISLFNRV